MNRTGILSELELRELATRLPQNYINNYPWIDIFFFRGQLFSTTRKIQGNSTMVSDCYIPICSDCLIHFYVVAWLIPILVCCGHLIDSYCSDPCMQESTKQPLHVGSNYVGINQSTTAWRNQLSNRCMQESTKQLQHVEPIILQLLDQSSLLKYYQQCNTQLHQIVTIKIR